MTTLKEALSSLRNIVFPKIKANIAEKLLGKYKGALLRNKSSTSMLKGLRGSLYGKIK